MTLAGGGDSMAQHNSSLAGTLQLFQATYSISQVNTSFTKMQKNSCWKLLQKNNNKNEKKKLPDGSTYSILL